MMHLSHLSHVTTWWNSRLQRKKEIVIQLTPLHMTVTKKYSADTCIPSRSTRFKQKIQQSKLPKWCWCVGSVNLLRIFTINPKFDWHCFWAYHNWGLWISSMTTWYISHDEFSNHVMVCCRLRPSVLLCLVNELSLKIQNPLFKTTLILPPRKITLLSPANYVYEITIFFFNFV